MRFFLFLLFFYSVLYSNCDNQSKKLIKAYSQIIDCQNNFLIWEDGTKTIFNDNIKKNNLQDFLNNADIEDMFYYEYPQGKNSYLVPKKDFDPGRIRNEEFMKKMYGHNKNEVSKNLVKIIWLPKSVNKPIYITKINGVSENLRKISDEIDKLPEEIKKYAIDIGGTYNWRNISGTNRLSVHSFGAAIDLNIKYSSYWKWDKNYKYKNEIPKEIVEIFEKYGFIWGGKWYHYDTMHFEYRPELLIKEI